MSAAIVKVVMSATIGGGFDAVNKRGQMKAVGMFHRQPVPKRPQKTDVERKTITSKTGVTRQREQLHLQCCLDVTTDHNNSANLVLMILMLRGSMQFPQRAGHMCILRPM